LEDASSFLKNVFEDAKIEFNLDQLDLVNLEEET